MRLVFHRFILEVVSVIVLAGYLVDLVEEPICECGIEIISYQLGEFGIDLVFSFRISNLRISKTFLLLLDTIIVMNSQKFPSTSYMLEYVVKYKRIRGVSTIFLCVSCFKKFWPQPCL